MTVRERLRAGTIVLVLASLLTSLPACDAHGGAPPDAPISDGVQPDAPPSGVSLAHNRIPAAVAQLGVAAEIDGAHDGRPFGHIEALAVDHLGRVYVADGQANVVGVYDASGVHVRDLGRPGQGPGEFKSVLGLTWRNETDLWVYDFGNARYSVYDTTGTLRRDVRRTATSVHWPWPGGWSDGELVETLDSRYRNALVGYRWSESSRELIPADTFPSPWLGRMSEARPSFTLRSATAIRLVPIPFAPTIQWALDGRDGVWVGDGASYELVRRSLTGDTVLIVRNEWEPFPVSEPEKDSAVASLGPPEAVARSLDLGKIPSSKPALVRLAPGPGGSLWVLRQAAGASWRFDVFSSAGQLVATLRVPVTPDTSVLPIVTDQAVWLVAQDEFEAQAVVRLVPG